MQAAVRGTTRRTTAQHVDDDGLDRAESDGYLARGAGEDPPKEIALSVELLGHGSVADEHVEPGSHQHRQGRALHDLSIRV
jgi:hypothetical protein